MSPFIEIHDNFRYVTNYIITEKQETIKQLTRVY